MIMIIIMGGLFLVAAKFDTLASIFSQISLPYAFFCSFLFIFLQVSVHWCNNDAVFSFFRLLATRVIAEMLNRRLLMIHEKTFADT